MTELERRLRDYGRGVRFPEEPDVWPAVETRLQIRRRRRRFVVPAAAAVAAAAVLAVAVAPARSALLELLGLDGVSVVRVDELPALAPPSPDDLGARTTLAAAHDAVPFELLALDDAEADAVYVGRDRPPAVSFVYGSATRPRLILTQFRPCCGQDSLTKEVPPGVRVARVRVDDAPGIWIGGDHAVRSGGETRLASSTLLWQRDRIIYRMEARLDREEALELAASLVAADAEE
jgi:hypothetical protein